MRTTLQIWFNFVFIVYVKIILYNHNGKIQKILVIFYISIFTTIYIRGKLLYCCIVCRKLKACRSAENSLVIMLLSGMYSHLLFSIFQISLNFIFFVFHEGLGFFDFVWVLAWFFILLVPFVYWDCFLFLILKYACFSLEGETGLESVDFFF